MKDLIEQLNDYDKNKRLSAVKRLYRLYEDGIIQKQPVDFEYVNNHIHTTYSFSPYSPSKAVWMAFISSLSTVGIMDHDSVGGVNEFIEAGNIVNIATTVGMELRVDMSGTRLEGKRINNPDQEGIAYVAMHGIPHGQLEKVSRFIKPYQHERGNRNKLMVKNINALVGDYGINLDYEKDVLPVSMFYDGGSVTERHVLYALSKKLMSRFGMGKNLADFLKDCLRIQIIPGLEQLLSDDKNPYYDYDLLGVLKSDFVEKFYVPADKECPHVTEFIRLCEETGSIASYAYLGDVDVSVTGDKKKQKYEDDYLDLLFEEITRLGFRAITYAPSRNTKEQLLRIKEYCGKYSLFQISGEDINTPRQEFICKALKDDMFENLKDAAWALIGHEKAASSDLDKAMFSPASDAKFVDLNDRIGYYKSIGKNALSYM
ncbi:MAG TPA: PHP domain-containing protein [Ruminiclostridium sp.]|nr:PHP domain-containing protein [Clostridiaceae bacterium]HAA24878.1 PHP domain-containing protein [Ruminiclostridium sp.]